MVYRHVVVAGRVLRVSVALACIALVLSASVGEVWAQQGVDAAGHLPRPLSLKPPSIRFDRVGLEDGLEQASATDIIQDRQGFVWISTQGGLHRYDGHVMKVYAPVPFDTTSLSSGYIWDLAEADDGDIWVATAGAGLNRLDPATGTAMHYRHDPDDPTSLASDDLRAVLDASTGDVWIATSDAGLHRMRPDEKGRFEHFRHDPDDPSTISSDRVYNVTEDGEGYIWAGTSNGVSRIDPRTGAVERFLYDPQSAGAAEGPESVFKPYHPPGKPDIVWLSTANGLVRLNHETGEHERFLIEPDEGGFDPINRLYEIIQDPENPSILWAAGNGTGLVRFDTRSETLATYRHDPNDPHSVSDNAGVSLMTDRSGMMWFGTVDGLNVFNPGAVDFTHFRHDPENPQSLAPGAVFGLYEDQSGALWAGTTTGQAIGFLTRFDGQTGRVTQYSTRRGGLQSGFPSAIAEDSGGNIWVGHFLPGGLSRIDGAGGHVTRFEHDVGEPGAAERNVIFDLLPTRSDPDVLWVGSRGGVDRFDTRAGRFTRIPLDSGLAADGVSALSLHEDGSSTLWIGTLNGGLFRVRGRTLNLAAEYDVRDTTSLSDNSIVDILEREREPGILWMATMNGLNRYDTRTGQARHYLREDGLPSNVIYGILEDAQGTLWMSTNGGISNFDPETETFRTYGLDDGLIALEHNQGAFAEGAGGIMYFGSLKGVTAFSPEDLGTNTIPPPVALTDFKLFNTSVDVGPGSLLEKSLAETEQITLSYDQNEVTFGYAGLHFENPEKNRFAYRLEGHDDGWIDAGNQRAATYTNLAPGTYTFHVKAANSDGVWNEEGASIGLRITPPWWRTTWAYVAFGLLFAAAALGVDRGQRRRLARKEAERAQIREAQLRAEAQLRRREDAERLSEIGRAITSTLSVTEVIDTVYEHVNALMDAAVFGIGLYDAETERLQFPGMKENGETLPPFSNDIDDESRPAVWCFKHRQAFVVGDFAAEYHRYLSGRKAPIEGEDAASIIYLPLTQQDKVVGVITTQSFEKNAYSEYHVSVLRTLATYAAIALDNAESYRKLGAALDDLQMTQERLVQQEKLASLGALTAGIAHEIKNPLNFITNFAALCRELAEDLRKEEDPEEARAILSDLIRNTEKIEEHGRRADSIVRSMMQHARSGSGVKQEVDLNALVHEHADLAYHGKRAQVTDFNVEFERDMDDAVGRVEVTPQDLGRVVLNLIGNAFDAVREKAESAGEAYRPSVNVSTRRTNAHVEIRVADNGAGIPRNIRDRIFEPFFTTKPAGSGTGLGLSLAHEIVAQGHGGTLTVDSEEGEGTTFVISLPAGHSRPA